MCAVADQGGGIDVRRLNLKPASESQIMPEYWACNCRCVAPNPKAAACSVSL